MNPHNYLVRLETLLQTRRDVIVHTLHVMVLTCGAIFTAEVEFSDGSRLSIAEEIELTGRNVVQRNAYKYHYQGANTGLIFRYDNAPHHPHIATFPLHKHIGTRVVESGAPDLADVLKEIDLILSP